RLLATRTHLTPDVVFEEARRELVCPFEVSLELTAQADVVLCDYNYVFDPVVSLSAVRDPGSLADAFLLVDEAHNLVDRGRACYSPELVDAELAVLAGRIAGSRSGAAPDALAAAQELRALVAGAAATLEAE